jgi:hypothetical protein
LSKRTKNDISDLLIVENVNLIKKENSFKLEEEQQMNDKPLNDTRQLIGAKYPHSIIS